VLQFAGLISAGLATLENELKIPWQIPKTRHKVLLSERGMQLVEAWMEGDERKYKELISTQKPSSEQAA